MSAMSGHRSSFKGMPRCEQPHVPRTFTFRSFNDKAEPDKAMKKQVFA
jgi:hypothetical protein